jgi:hypothetical protein
LTLSGQNKVVIMEAHFGLSDKYRCEVSVEAPSFDTALVMAPVYVVGKSHTYITTALLLSTLLGYFSWAVVEKQRPAERSQPRLIRGHFSRRASLFKGR